MRKDIFEIDASEYAKGLNDIRLKAKKFRSDMTEILGKMKIVLETPGVETAVTKRFGAGAFAGYKKLFNEVKKGMEAFVKAWEDAMKGALTREALEERAKLHAEHVEEITENEYEAYKKLYGENVELALKAYDAKQKAELQKSKVHLAKLQRQLKQVLQAEEIDWIDVESILQQIGDVEIRSKEIVKNSTADIMEIKLNAIDEVHERQLDVIDAEVQNELEKSKLIRDAYAARVRAIEEVEGIGVLAHNEALLQLKQADREYVRTLTNTWGDAMGVIGESLEDLGGIMDDELGKTMEEVNKIADGIFNLIQGIAKENYVQAIAGGLEAIIGVVEAVVRRINEAREKESKLIEAENKEREKTTKALREFRGALNELRIEMIDLFREILGLDFAAEDIVRRKTSLMREFYDIPGVKEVSGMASLMRASGIATGETPTRQEKLFWANPSRIADIVTTIASRFTTTQLGNIAFGSEQALEDFKAAMEDLGVSEAMQDFIVGNMEIRSALAGLATDFKVGQIQADDMMDGLAMVMENFTIDLAAIVAKPLDDIAEILEDDVVTQEEYLKHLLARDEEWRKILKEPTLKDLPMIKGEDFLANAEEIFNLQKEAAKKANDPSLLRKAYQEYENRIRFVIGTFEDISRDTRDDLLKMLAITLPQELAEGLQVIDDSIVQSGENLQNIAKKISVSMEDYKQDLEDIDNKYKNIKSTWESLIEERDKLIAGEDEETQRLKREAEERINALEEEREAIIGTFDFSETQNVRSQRFAKARKIEMDILEEVEKLNERLTELEQKRMERLAELKAEIKELENVWGSLYGLEINWQRERTFREREFTDLLVLESQAVRELTGEYKNLYSLFRAGELPDWIQETGAFIPRKFTTIPIRTEPPPEPIVGPTVPTVTLPAMPVEEEEKEPVIYSPHMPPSKVSAQHGFEGIIRKPTNIRVGEFSRPEMVSIKPLADKINGLAARSVTNIFINENLDFRGAYGINNKKMAEQVYRNVWAPARRNNLNKYLNPRGKVIR
jgi:hypothetical protein